MLLTPKSLEVFAPGGALPHLSAPQEMGAPGPRWLPWEDQMIRTLTEPARRAGKKMSWVRVCDHLPHRSAQECRARARRLWINEQSGFVPKPPRAHPYDLGTAAAEAICLAMEALGHKRVDTCADKAVVYLDPYVLWRAPSHDELLDEHGELVCSTPPKHGDPVEVDAYSDALCAW
jgi:hypothetical protein